MYMKYMYMNTFSLPPFRSSESHIGHIQNKMPNFLNGIICLPFLELSVIIFRDIKMRTWSWSANSIETGETAWICRLTWFQRLITFGSSRIGGNWNAIATYCHAHSAIIHSMTPCLWVSLTTRLNTFSRKFC